MRETARAMSDRDQEIISSLRRAYEAFSRADFDTAVEIAHPDVEFVLPWRSVAAERRGRAAGVDGA